jgi:hypothetical protein
MSASLSPRPADPVSSVVQRLVAASGIAFAILFVIGILVSGDNLPDDDAAITEWTQYARDDGDNVRIGALIFALAAYNFLLFLGFLRSAIGEAERAVRGFTRGGYIILAAGTAGITGITIAIGLAAAATDEDTPPEVLKAVIQTSDGAWLMAAAGFGACFVTVGLVNQAVRALPAWLGWVALGTGIAAVLQLGVLTNDDEDNIFGIFFPISFLLLIIFTTGASIHFLRGLTRPAATAPEAQPPPPPA